MPATVIVNKMTVVHQSSSGIRSSFPDVCKTPMAPSPVPIPYPNISQSTDASDTASTVTADGNPIMVKDSVFRMSTGDEAGSLLGVVSNKIKGTAKPTMFSMDVKAEGKNVFRQLDIMLGNGNHDPTNDITIPNMQPPDMAVPEGQDPIEYKITETKWTKEKCKCGDVVGIETKGENLDGEHIMHKLFRMEDDPPLQVGVRGAPMSGGTVKLDWLSVHGKWRKPPSTFNILCDGLGGPKDSAKSLTIEIPADKTETMKGSYNFRALVKVPAPSPGGPVEYLSEGKAYRHKYGYDLILKEGILEIFCKIKLNLIGNWDARRLLNVKGRALREILACWDRKHKLHRKECKRGQSCRCTPGCCIFPIRVTCLFVQGGQHKDVNLHAGTRIKRVNAWDAGNWFERLAPEQNPFPPPYAHEFGHAIGMLDEYAGASFLIEHYDDRNSIMGHGDQVMAHHWMEYPTAGRSPHRWMERHAGDKYDVLPGTA